MLKTIYETTGEAHNKTSPPGNVKIKWAANPPTIAIAFPIVGTTIAKPRLEKNQTSEVTILRLFSQTSISCTVSFRSFIQRPRKADLNKTNL